MARNPSELTIGVMNMYVKRAGTSQYLDLGALRDSSFQYAVELREHMSPLPNSTVMARDKVVVIQKTASVRGTVESLNLNNLRLALGGATLTGTTATTGAGGLSAGGALLTTSSVFSGASVSGAVAGVSGGQLSLGETTSVEEVEFVGIHRFPDGYYLNLKFWKSNAAGAFDLPFNQNDWVGYPVEVKALSDYSNHASQPFGFLEISPVALLATGDIVGGL